MPLNDITFIKGVGGLGRALAGEDYISGMLFYSANLPSGFNSSNRIKQVFSIQGAEALGIVDTNTDETKAQGQVTVTAVGANGDVISVIVTEPTINGGTNVVTLGSFVKTATETTPTLLATALTAAINAGTVTHGYTATSAAGVITVIARSGLGVALNTGTPLGVTITGTIAATVTTAFSGGIGSQLAVFHYQIQEYFRIQPQGNLFVGIFAVPSTYTFSEVTLMQSFAVGKIRQIGVYKDAAAFYTADLTALQLVCAANDAIHKPLSSLYAANMVSVTNLATLTDLGLLTSNKASAVISQDGGAKGANLFLSYGKSITNIGAVLGTVSLSKVSDCIAWIQQYNNSNGTECDTVAFANGQLYSAIDPNLISQLNSYRYLFLTKRIGITGSYWNDSHTAIAISSDYAYIEGNRTIDKAIRGVYASLLPSIASPLTLNADGSLTDNTVAALESACAPNLDAMVRNGELSVYSVTIDPAQLVQTTGKLKVSIRLVAIGVARNFEVTIGYVISL